MTERIDSWEKAVAFALALPDTELSTSYGKPAVKVASNGRAFLYTGHEDRDLVRHRDRSRHGRDAEGDRSGNLLANARTTKAGRRS